MMRSYRIDEPNETSRALGEKITALVVASAVTYREAEDALQAAHELLEMGTKPVRIDGLPSGGSGQTA